MDKRPVSHARLLADSQHACLIAPAGCGKTEVIAKAVALLEGDKRQLILTHTHAGVDALRRRMRKLQVPSRKYHIDTIAGWALRYASAFPQLSGLVGSQPVSGEWRQVYRAAAIILQNSTIKKVVSSSYGGVYVDEYQDCTKAMHELVSSLADILPCRILGDPLQGIFDFEKDDSLINWGEDISAEFSILPELGYGWRWASISPSLGQWLLKVRQCLVRGIPVDLGGAPASVKWKPLPEKKFQTTRRLEVCREVAENKGSVVAILQWPAQCHQVAARLNGRFQSVEPMECKDLFDSAEKIFSKVGAERALGIVEFCSKCLTKVKTELKSVCRVIKTGKIQNREYKYQEQLDALLAVSCGSSESLQYSLEALLAVKRIPGAVLYRRELFDAMCHSIREYESEKHENLREAAISFRNRLRRTGRFSYRRIVASTLLVKGLEYDHAVILDADSMDLKNLYVAMTRGKETLTIMSKRRIISPKM